MREYDAALGLLLVVVLVLRQVLWQDRYLHLMAAIFTAVIGIPLAIDLHKWFDRWFGGLDDLDIASGVCVAAFLAWAALSLPTFALAYLELFGKQPASRRLRIWHKTLAAACLASFVVSACFYLVWALA